MPREEQYLVRGDDGKMVTINAYSVNGCRDIYLEKHRPRRGTQFSIKPRGHGDWEHFDVL